MIVENVQTSNQTHLGKLTPRAPQERFSSAFAVRDGNCPTGWNTVDDMKHGVSFGERMEKRLVFHEHVEDGKPHDVEFNGLKLREMRVERAYVDRKDKLEGDISTRKREAIENAHSSSEGGVTRSSQSTAVIHRSETPPDAMLAAYDSAPAQPPAKNKGGRPRKIPAPTAPTIANT